MDAALGTGFARGERPRTARRAVLNLYVDTSHVIKLLVDESDSGTARELWDAAATATSSTLLAVEGRAALARARRERRLTPASHDVARGELGQLVGRLHLVAASRGVTDLAADLVDEHGLRAYDAVHLASALVAPVLDVFSTWDVRLRRAASAHGLAVAP